MPSMMIATGIALIITDTRILGVVAIAATGLDMVTVTVKEATGADMAIGVREFL